MSVPPGASYQASNTYVKLKRRLLNLEAPVRIQFKDEWDQGNPLYDWYQRRNFRQITAMQLRKEKNAPFFHQYIVFELSGGHYFRIDRRQLPDETTPLDCIYEQGVDAYDTIEQVTSFEDASYSRSDCLVEIQFGEAISLELVLKILWAIHWHPSTRVYTLQRYNCYFVSQTILFLSAKSDLGFYSLETDAYVCLISPNYTYTTQYDWNQVISTQNPHIVNFDENDRPILEGPDSLVAPLASVLVALFQQLNRCDQGFHKMCLTHWRSCLVCTGQRTAFSSSATVNENTRRYTQDRLNIPDFTDRILIRFQNSLVDFCKNTLKNFCDTQAKKIMAKLPEVYDKDKLDQVMSEEIGAAIAFDYDLKTSWTNYVHDALQRLAKDINPIVQRALECPTWEPTLTPEVTVENIVHLRKMDNWVECVSKFFEAEYHRLEKAFKAEVMARLNMRLARPSVMRLDNLTASESSNSKDTGMEGSPTRRLSNWRRRGRLYAPKGNIAGIRVLKNYLDALVMTHCIRVEQYRFWLKCTREEVYADINRTQEEIWRVVVEVTHGPRRTAQ